MADNNNPFKIDPQELKKMTVSFGKYMESIKPLKNNYDSLLHSRIHDISQMRIDIPEDPLIQIGKDQLLEYQKMNATLIALQNRISELETNASAEAKANIKRQWAIGIASALIGAIASFIILTFV